MPSRNAYFEQDFGHQERNKAIAAVRKIEPEIPSTLVMRELPKPRPTHVFLGGEFLNKGIRVEPGTPAALPPLPRLDGYNRVDLARWLVSEKNPLTPRVTMNRIWQRYFGRGIVETENDFRYARARRRRTPTCWTGCPRSSSSSAGA